MSPRSHPKPRRDRSKRVAELLEENERPLVAYAARMLRGDVAKARDVIQDVFLRLCREEDVHSMGREWLFKVARNRCIDERRRLTLMPSQIPETLAGQVPTGAPPPEQGLLDAEASSGLASAMETLPEPQREVLRLKFEAGLSYAEIAGVTGDPVGTVGWLIHTAIKSLRTRMTAAEGGAR